MKDSKEKDLELKEEVKPNAEALEADRELNPEELDEVAGGRRDPQMIERFENFKPVTKNSN